MNFLNKSKTRKTLLTCLALTALAGPLPGIAAADGDGTPAAANAVIAADPFSATLSIAGARSSQLLESLKSNIPVDQYEHADYKAKSAKLQAAVLEATKHFQKVLAEEIKPKLASYVAIYNSQVVTDQHDTAENDVIRQAALNQIKAGLVSISRQYQTEIMKLYRVGGVTLAGEAPLVDQEKYCDVSNGWQDSVNGQKPTNYGRDTFDKFHSKVFGEHVLPALLDGCASSTCVSLSALDEAILIARVGAIFDTPLKVTLADGQSVSLDGNAAAIKNKCGYQMNPAENPDSFESYYSDGIKRTAEFIASVDYMPPFVSQLPFDASEKGLADAIQNTQKLYIAQAKSGFKFESGTRSESDFRSKPEFGSGASVPLITESDRERQIVGLAEKLSIVAGGLEVDTHQSVPELLDTFCKESPSSANACLTQKELKNLIEEATDSPLGLDYSSVSREELAREITRESSKFGHNLKK